MTDALQTLASRLVDFDWKVLEMLDGRRELPWGAAVGECLEHLSGLGLATKMPYAITETGRAVLEQRNHGHE